MIITLSEKRNEKVVFVWAEEMTEQHAQDFCDVCNAVFKKPHYTVPYIMSRFGVNIYGGNGGFIVVAYKDDEPLAALGGIRDDFNSRTAFQLEHFASMPAARKSGYVLDVIYCIFDEVSKRYPTALIYGFPGEQAYPVDAAAGFVLAEFYQRIFHGSTEDFLQSMPLIDDEFAENFTLRKKRAAILTVKGKCYACFPYFSRKIIPTGIIVGEVSSKFKGTVPNAGKFRLYYYHSLKPGILGRRALIMAATYQLGASQQTMDVVPPMYKHNGRATDFYFNGLY